MARATNARRPKGRTTTTPRQFARSIVEEIDQTKYLGIKHEIIHENAKARKRRTTVATQTRTGHDTVESV
jgi:hypothetical protein